jgi:hypothetical protein
MTKIETTKSSPEKPAMVGLVAPTPAIARTKEVKLVVEKIASPIVGSPETYSITVAPGPTGKIEWYENVPLPLVVALVGLISVCLTVWLGYWRMQKELGQAVKLADDARDDSREQADKDRTLTREQANNERQHSADEAHRERIATSRRTVYLEAAKQVTMAHAFLGGLPNQPITGIAYQEGLGNLGVAISQITILGEMGTVLKSREVHSLINQTFFKAMARTISIASTKDDIANHGKKRDLSNAQVEFINEKLQTLKGHYSRDTAELGRELREQLALAAEHANAVVDSHKILVQLQMSYFDFMLQEMVEINKCTDELMVMIRFELGLNTDSDALTQSSRTMHKQAKHAMDELRIVLANNP